MNSFALADDCFIQLIHSWGSYNFLKMVHRNNKDTRKEFAGALFIIQFLFVGLMILMFFKENYLATFFEIVKSCVYIHFHKVAQTYAEDAEDAEEPSSRN